MNILISKTQDSILQKNYISQMQYFQIFKRTKISKVNVSGLIRETNSYEPKIRGTNAPVLVDEIFQDLLKMKSHIGTNNWTKEMSRYLLGSRNGVSIINLEYTFISLKRVLKFLENYTKYNKTKGLNSNILFVNTYNKYSELVKHVAIRSNQSYINDRWIGGTITNWKQISESILLYDKFHRQFDEFLKMNNIQIPIYEKAKKRYEGLELDRRSSGIGPSASVIENRAMQCIIPDIIILTNPDQNNILIQEAQLYKIPVIAFADSNTLIKGIDYIIPGNNKSIYFMYFCLNLITITLQRNNLGQKS